MNMQHLAHRDGAGSDLYHYKDDRISLLSYGRLLKDATPGASPLTPIRLPKWYSGLAPLLATIVACRSVAPGVGSSPTNTTDSVLSGRLAGVEYEMRGDPSLDHVDSTRAYVLTVYLTSGVTAKTRFVDTCGSNKQCRLALYNHARDVTGVFFRACDHRDARVDLVLTGQLDGEVPLFERYRFHPAGAP
jgi:hypothetical protein